MATDSDQFIFAILQGDRKTYVFKPVDWLEETDLVISCHRILSTYHAGKNEEQEDQEI